MLLRLRPANTSSAPSSWGEFVDFWQPPLTSAVSISVVLIKCWCIKSSLGPANDRQAAETLWLLWLMNILRAASAFAARSMTSMYRRKTGDYWTYKDYGSLLVCPVLLLGGLWPISLVLCCRPLD